MGILVFVCVLAFPCFPWGPKPQDSSCVLVSWFLFVFMLFLAFLGALNRRILAVFGYLGFLDFIAFWDC